MNPKALLVPVLLLVISGCGLFDAKETSKPGFVGEWRSSMGFDFTMGDSLYRDSLSKYMLAQGIDLDSLFDFGSSYQVDRRKFDSLSMAFAWTCPPEVDCHAVVWARTVTEIFTADSIFTLGYRNGILADSSSNPYAYSDDSIFNRVPQTYNFAQHYEFKPGGDTLILFWPYGDFGGLNDTLVRLR
jgi:hypothetical protein